MAGERLGGAGGVTQGWQGGRRRGIGGVTRGWQGRDAAVGVNFPAGGREAARGAWGSAAGMPSNSRRGCGETAPWVAPVSLLPAAPAAQGWQGRGVSLQGDRLAVSIVAHTPIDKCSYTYRERTRQGGRDHHTHRPGF